MKRIDISQLLADQTLLEQLYSDLDAGAVAIIPTDTLYGFAVAAHLPDAVARIYAIKNRDARKPLILFLNAIEQLAHNGFDVSSGLLETLQKHWPGALTAILHKPENQHFCAFSFAKLGVRIPAHAQLQQLLVGYQHKLLTTSANRSGEPSDCDPDKLAAEFAGEIDWLIDGGTLKPALPSTVADFTVTPPLILRQGAVRI
ncbi:MAG: threonylcarbamoyl-AMP synthase [Candidatus Riflebacteria bacterium HGW-Riflebacteria-2]|jgi:L-threonylcarbamoyladenylate synthase|nr:MAG: threonylcarbamoyl-AMP synthase [Candidatus Riflebacteria bacterium HGW-Riflebacteria-2]